MFGQRIVIVVAVGVISTTTFVATTFATVITSTLGTRTTLTTFGTRTTLTFLITLRFRDEHAV